MNEGNKLTDHEIEARKIVESVLQKGAPEQGKEEAIKAVAARVALTTGISIEEALSRVRAAMTAMPIESMKNLGEASREAAKRMEQHIRESMGKAAEEAAINARRIAEKVLGTPMEATQEGSTAATINRIGWLLDELKEEIARLGAIVLKK